MIYTPFSPRHKTPYGAVPSGTAVTFTLRPARSEGFSSGLLLARLEQDGDRLLVVNSLLCGEYEVGDIVIARKESFDAQPIVKRVIATEGQTVDIDFNLGRVYVDGVMLEEDYINDLTYREEGTLFPLTVPEGEVFLLGDNRNHSNDSRDSSLGTVDTRLLIGKAVFLVFPGRDYLTEQREFGRIGLLK